MSLAESAIAETAIADSAFFTVLVSGSDTVIVSIVDEKTISLNNNIYIISDISPSYIENIVSMQSVFTSVDAFSPVLLTDEYSFVKFLIPGFLMPDIIEDSQVARYFVNQSIITPSITDEKTISVKPYIIRSDTLSPNLDEILTFHSVLFTSADNLNVSLDYLVSVIGILFRDDNLNIDLIGQIESLSSSQITSDILLVTFDDLQHIFKNIVNIDLIVEKEKEIDAFLDELKDIDLIVEQEKEIIIDSGLTRLEDIDKTE